MAEERFSFSPHYIFFHQKQNKSISCGIYFVVNDASWFGLFFYLKFVIIFTHLISTANVLYTDREME